VDGAGQRLVSQMQHPAALALAAPREAHPRLNDQEVMDTKAESVPMKPQVPRIQAPEEQSVTSQKQEAAPHKQALPAQKQPAAAQTKQEEANQRVEPAAAAAAPDRLLQLPQPQRKVSGQGKSRRRSIIDILNSSFSFVTDGLSSPDGGGGPAHRLRKASIIHGGARATDATGDSEPPRKTSNSSVFNFTPKPCAYHKCEDPWLPIFRNREHFISMHLR